jgi:DNA-binding IclR family transcriptional regulator
MTDYRSLAKDCGLNAALQALEGDIMMGMLKDSYSDIARTLRLPKSTVRSKIQKLGLMEKKKEVRSFYLKK